MIKNNSEYYDAHWASFADVNYPDVKIDRAAYFFNPVINYFQPNKSILDVGFGDGVHWYYLKKLLKLNVHYHGIEISRQSVDFMKNLDRHNESTFGIMDACQMDFPDQSFDYVFAYGVIGYTDSSEKSFQEMVRVCRPGGLVGVFSPEIIGVPKLVLRIVRKISSHLGNKAKFLLADLLVPFFGIAPSGTAISLSNASWKQVREVILTDIAPPNLTLLSHETIIHWFKTTRLKVLHDDIKIRTMIWGHKPLD